MIEAVSTEAKSQTIRGYRHQPAPLSVNVENEIIEKCLLIRRVEEQLLKLFSDGKLFGTVHTCIGQEFSGPIIAHFLGKGDSIFSNHRCHGHFLAKTGDVDGLIAEVMGKATGVCGGVGGTQHLYKKGFYSNGIQGGIIPVATGLAFAKRIKNDRDISVVFIGDGTLGEGVLYESFNIASKWNLPLLVVLENNKYAQSTHQTETLAGSIKARAESFGIRAESSSTEKWRDLFLKAGELMSYVREEQRPAFLEIETYRLKAHSKGDDNRPRSEVAAFETRDPLNIVINEQSQWLREADKKHQLIIEKAVTQAEVAPFPQLRIPSVEVKPLQWSTPVLAHQRLAQAINSAFKKIMEQNDKVFLIGEDIRSPYGGAFKVTNELSDLFSERVLNSPISEAAIVGLGTGLALEGYRPFIEIMFGDFTGLAFDQIVNHAAKFEDMYNSQVKVNIVIRTPMGGRRGYGPTHSQTLEKHFLGVPGLKIVAINNFMDPSLIYENLANGDYGPTLVIENKALYSQFLRSVMPDGFLIKISNDAFPAIHILPQSSAKPDITLIGYGGMSELLLEAAQKLFEDEDILAQIFCPTQIYPFDAKSYAVVFHQAPRLLFIEEGQGFSNFSSEIIAQLSESNSEIPYSFARVASAPTVIPASGVLEKQVLPSAEMIVMAAKKLCIGTIDE